MSLKRLVWLSTIAHCVSGSLPFLSRPDLSPPKLNITVPASSQTETGYLFFTAAQGDIPGSVGPDQPGAYIFQDDGELVWSGAGYFAGWVANFGPVVIDGKPALRAFQGDVIAATGRMLGNHAILDNSYQTVSITQAAAHRLSSAHEFEIVGGRSILMETPVMTVVDFSAYGGDHDQRFLLEELDLKTGELMFEWSSQGIMNPADSAILLDKEGVFDGRTQKSAWNYFHINSIDKDDQGNYLISARHYNAIFKINGSSGDVIWQLGGETGSDFHIPPNAEFAFQHDARFQYRSEDGQIERIYFFDNAAYSSPEERFLLVQGEMQTYNAPDNLTAHTQGSFRFLPNGNRLVNWGSAGAITEFADNGMVLFHAYLDSYPSKNVQSYRAFRANWTGSPSEDPAVLALKLREEKIAVWVSWNGDTETKTWNFHLQASEVAGTISLGSVQRSGFETRFEMPLASLSLDLKNIQDFSVIAEAIDSNGVVMRRSRPVAFSQDRSGLRILADLGEQQDFHRAARHLRLEL
ncbi:uncharacterized protein N7469_006798 [Penicillium citrinum]|uniref:Uncharacterized protein n=1 Tax=Penicillium citrinum TaxID=5077 RepID=A0A9W9NVL9_PENCI|nr:uncharacterized protein N7469_006798 [Penicillium citrinum]KAJ5226792.1 hypothetical protein N7469_006798 [Penicillium citrinum]